MAASPWATPLGAEYHAGCFLCKLGFELEDWCSCALSSCVLSAADTLPNPSQVPIVHSEHPSLGLLTCNLGRKICFPAWLLVKSCWSTTQAAGGRGNNAGACLHWGVEVCAEGSSRSFLVREQQSPPSLDPAHLYCTGLCSVVWTCQAWPHIPASPVPSPTHAAGHNLILGASAETLLCCRATHLLSCCLHAPWDPTISLLNVFTISPKCLLCQGRGFPPSVLLSPGLQECLAHSKCFRSSC